MFRLRKETGFTLMEMLAVIFIMAVLAGIMLPALRRVREGGRVTHARNEINQLITAIRMYAEDWGVYPVVDSLVEYPSAVLLDALESYSHWPDVVKHETTGELLDPWGRPYIYRHDPDDPALTIEGSAVGVAFNIYSAGPDMIYGTEADITNW